MMKDHAGIELSAPTFKFASHETFHLRDGWLYKGLGALQHDSFFLAQDDAHHKLGIGINMLKALIYWLRATNLVKVKRIKGKSKPELELTPLAKLIWENDPYFEDIRTLWLLHIELCSNRELATFWYWIFNECSQREFTEEKLIQSIQNYIDDNGAKHVFTSSLSKDIHCLIRTYVSSDDKRDNFNFDTIDCPLTSLGLIRRSVIPGHYKFVIGEHASLSSKLFTYALYRFRDSGRVVGNVFSFEDIRWAPLSPGRTLCLDMHSILQYLEEIEHHTPYLHITRTAELNVVTLEESVQTNKLLEDCISGGD